MTTLLVGFDSAWTSARSGALVGLLRSDDGAFRELRPPQVADFCRAQEVILAWQDQENPTATIVMLDQPTIVRNATGQRPVENLVASVVSRRYGGMQPANTSREGMFDQQAPIWRFLARFGGPADPRGPLVHPAVYETYPVLAIIALGWTLPDSRPTGRLPKYNPERRTFSIADWRHVCLRMAGEFDARGLSGLVRWLRAAAENSSPRKNDQDCLDACICLLVACYLVEIRECLMIGNTDTGYILVPSADGLCAELQVRCTETSRVHADWGHSFVLISATVGAGCELSNTTFDRTAGSSSLAAAGQRAR
jgi:predicted RNase H-like nuclease